MKIADKQFRLKIQTYLFDIFCYLCSSTLLPKMNPYINFLQYKIDQSNFLKYKIIKLTTLQHMLLLGKGCSVNLVIKKNKILGTLLKIYKSNTYFSV